MLVLRPAAIRIHHDDRSLFVGHAQRMVWREIDDASRSAAFNGGPLGKRVLAGQVFHCVPVPILTGRELLRNPARDQWRRHARAVHRPDRAAAGSCSKRALQHDRIVADRQRLRTGAIRSRAPKLLFDGPAGGFSNVSSRSRPTTLRTSLLRRSGRGPKRPCRRQKRSRRQPSIGWASSRTGRGDHQAPCSLWGAR
jgi:hypothetical protein